MLLRKAGRSADKPDKATERTSADRRKRERRLGLSDDIYQGAENRTALRRTMARRH